MLEDKIKVCVSTCNVIFFPFTESNLTYSQVQMILKERCDGNRNILHACVNMCSPTSNKETEQGNVLDAAELNMIVSKGNCKNHFFFYF